MGILKKEENLFDVISVNFFFSVLWSHGAWKALFCAMIPILIAENSS